MSNSTQLVFLLFLVINLQSLLAKNASSFNLILTIDGDDHYFRFFETMRSNENHPLPSVIILDDDPNPTSRNSSSSSIHTYHVESNENTFNIATVVNQTHADSTLLFALIQTTNGSFYDIIPSISTVKTRPKRSLDDNYIIKHNGAILEHAYVSIEWHHNRERRATKPKKKSPIEKPIPKKTRHLYLEIVAVVDSLILLDVQTLLNKTELETIEILKIYYIHIFIGVEQLFRQSLRHETLEIHIQLSKIIFSTAKHRLPWELFKNISSITNAYRKSPNNIHLRPNMTKNLLSTLHQAYTSNQFDRRFFPKTVDHIMTFTRLDLIDGAGSAYVNGLCSLLYKYSLVQEDLNSLSVILTAAHELGHNLGLNHDETENECNDTRVRYIMSSKNMHTVDRRQVAYFSQCSIKQLKRFVDTTRTKCWRNPVVSTQNHTKLRSVISTKLGQIIHLRQQCQLQYGLQAIPFISVAYNKSQALYEENICEELQCFKRLADDFMYLKDGAFDGTPCGENRVCHQKKCMTTKQKIKRSNLAMCPYGDLSVPVRMLNLKDQVRTGNMHCSDALNLLRARGMNVTYLCYNSTWPYERLCCEECKKHLIPECGDSHPRCSTFAHYCQLKLVRVDGRPVTELCPYTCGRCRHLPLPRNSTATTTSPQTLSKDGRRTSSKTPRKYLKPKQFTVHTCIDRADCSQLIKLYSKLKKNVKNWCAEYSTTIKDRYFVEMCPRYCSLCNITSECDRYKLCRNGGKCIKDEHGTYQCICSSSKPAYGTLCEYRRTCWNQPCSSKKEYCLQTQGENYLCLSKEDKEQIRIILK